MCDGEAVGGIVEVCDVDGCGTVGVCATEGRAVDELCSTLEMNGASVDSGAGSCASAVGVSACDEADRV